MVEMVSDSKKVMHQLHDGVKYGGGLKMSDQIQGTVDKIASFYKGDYKDDIITAAYLHKCLEVKRINPDQLVDGKAPYTLLYIKKQFGARVAQIVSEVSSEPRGDDLKNRISCWKQNNPQIRATDKKIEWNILSAWAKGLSKEAQVILLAEKLQNFEVSRDNPNPEKPIEWHREYYATRMMMVDTIRDASPELYQQCVKVKKQGEDALDARMIEEDTKTYIQAKYWWKKGAEK